MTETPDPTDKDLDNLADKLYKRIKQKQQEETEQNEERKKIVDPDARPYAVCQGCQRILTRSQYEGPSCPYCGGTQAIQINYANYTANQ